MMLKNTLKTTSEISQIRQIFSNLNFKYRYVRTHSCMSSDGFDQTYGAYHEDIHRIQNALRKLKVDEAYIITQTFRGDGTCSNEWWKGMYSKTTFYRIRQKAIQNFLKEYFK